MTGTNPPEGCVDCITDSPNLLGDPRDHTCGYMRPYGFFGTDPMTLAINEHMNATDEHTS